MNFSALLGLPIHILSKENKDKIDSAQAILISAISVAHQDSLIRQFSYIVSKGRTPIEIIISVDTFMKSLESIPNPEIATWFRSLVIEFDMTVGSLMGCPIRVCNKFSGVVMVVGEVIWR